MTNDPLNILLTNATDIYGGGEYYVLELARSLRHRGHNVWVSCRPDNLLATKCIQAGISVLPIDFPSRGSLFKNIALLKQIIQRHNIQILHSNSNYDRTAGAFAAKLARIRHVTNVHSFHSIQHNPTQWLRNKNATDQFIVDGFCVKDLLMREDCIAQKRITVIHLGVDPESMRRDEKLRHAVRNEFKLDSNHMVIGNVGRLVLMKGQKYLLQAFSKLAIVHPDARLLLIGDGELRHELEQIAASLHILDRVIFAGFRDDLQAVYSAFDIYAHPSIEGGGETFPFAVLQALAQELPVVVTRVGDVPYMVEEGINGFVVPDRNVDDFEERLRRVLENSSLRQTMSRKSRELLLKNFTINNMVDAVLGVYTSVL
jgi:glycosyltransferase involved in cell wall biosynthesis